jgi:hypothetical protein
MRTELGFSVLVVNAVAISMALTSGCGGTATVGPPSQPAVTGQSQAVKPATADSSAISPELVQKVNDLIRSNKEYIALAESIKTLDDYKKNADELSRIEQESSSLVEDVMIAEAKLTAAQKAEFTSKYYESLAKPTIDLKKQHTMRMQSLLR